MKLSLNHIAQARENCCPASSALTRWYGEHAVVRRLWAIRPADDSALRVIVMLDPSLDGDEVGPTWMAHGNRWARDLQKLMTAAVQLERIDGPLPDEFEIDGEGVLIASLCWRDSTALET